MQMTRIAWWTGIATLGLVFGISPTQATDLPPVRDVYDLLRTNLHGWSAEEFEQAASKALLDRFGGILGDGAADSAALADTPALANKRVLEKLCAYVRIGQVTLALAPQLSAALADPEFISGREGLVLDLRFATGADFRAAANAASLFIAAGQPVFDWGEGMVTSPESTNTWTLPLIVLVNSRTSGSAEALAGALRQAGRGLILGSRTAGQSGAMQELPLSDGRKLRLPLAPVRFGNRETLPANGLTPDIVINVQPEREKEWLENPWQLTPEETSKNATNKAVGSVTARKRLNEAELVRSRRAVIKNPDDPDAVAVPPGAAAPSTDLARPIRDPALGRAMDLLKGLAALRRN